MNTVLETTQWVVDNAQHVRINNKLILQVAQQYLQEGLAIEHWKAPVFPEKTNQDTIDFFMVGNVINAAYNDFNNPDSKWTIEYDKIPFPCAGSFGMWAALTRAMEEGIPITNGTYLKTMTKSDATHIFRGNIEIPLIDQRVEFLNNAGEVLNKKYQGRFSNLITQTNRRLFTSDNKGCVDQLVEQFFCYQDSSCYKGNKIQFNKRAQLAPAMVQARYLSEGITMFDDIDALTVFADYNLPRALYDVGILEYTSELEQKIWNKEIISPHSDEEIEIRAATIHAADRLISKVNEYGGNINALHLDFRLFSHGRAMNKRNTPAIPIHLTPTMAY